jgi:hypothetical protein
MDSTGKIYDLNALGVSDEEAQRKGLTPIPAGMVTKVQYLTRPQRRKWRELVQGGIDAQLALMKAQL